MSKVQKKTVKIFISSKGSASSLTPMSATCRRANPKPHRTTPNSCNTGAHHTNCRFDRSCR
eukprot:2111282-Amphidinium_carterae.1